MKGRAVIATDYRFVIQYEVLYWYAYELSKITGDVAEISEWEGTWKQ